MSVELRPSDLENVSGAEMPVMLEGALNALFQIPKTKRTTFPRAPPIAPAPDRCARRLDRGKQGGVDFLHSPELRHASGDRDEPVRLARLQPHELDMLAQRLLVLAEAFTDLAQTLPRLGRVGANRREGTQTPKPATGAFWRFSQYCGVVPK